MPATHDEDAARDLRDRLLGARYQLLKNEEKDEREVWDSAERAAYDDLAERNIDGRTREKLLSLVTVAVIWDRVDELEPFVEEAVSQDRKAAADSDDAPVLMAIKELAHEAAGETAVIGDADPSAAVDIPISEIKDRYETLTGAEEANNSWIGQVRGRLGLEKKRKRDGTVIADPDLGPKLRDLCEEHNLEWEPLDAHDPFETLDPDESGVGM